MCATPTLTAGADIYPPTNIATLNIAAQNEYCAFLSGSIPAAGRGYLYRFYLANMRL
jgi:hypothetical protein